MTNKQVQRVVLASGNRGKLKELGAMLAPLGFSLHPQGEFDVPDAIEDGLSFIENALKKARHASALTSLPAIADDSGLCVDALDGAPGIYSARYAGEPSNDGNNNTKLLQSLHGQDRRSAHFHCVLAMVQHAEDPAPILREGIWYGEILDAPRGENGFGYDPLFWVPERQCSSAELPAEVKNRISHRGQAVAALSEQLRQRLATH